jgi:PelA/Pel-15E family pectate lyase
MGMAVWSRPAFGLAVAFMAGAMAFAEEAAKYRAIPLTGFTDVIHHWRNQNDMYDQEYPRYQPEQIVEIADNLLHWQRANGGWSTNQDPARILAEHEKKMLRENRGRTDTSFDNRNTYPQIEYLAHAFNQTGEARFREGCLRGIEFILETQYESGGWAHSPPRSDSYYAHITFADDIMPGILRLLRKVADGREPFAFVDGERRARASAALQRGDDCLLRLQVRIDGVSTIWAGQYDHATLQPAKARSFELPGLVSRESVEVVRYLMSIPNPSPEVVQAVEAAVAWYEKSKLTGIRLERITADRVRFDHHTSKDDLQVVKDDNAPPIWARFYDLENNHPFMANRDGRKVYSLAKVERERRTGYDWYGYWPRDLLAREYPAWRKAIEAAKSTP